MSDQIICPDCNHTPEEPHTTIRYGGIERVFCERCQRWFPLTEKFATVAKASKNLTFPNLVFPP